MFGCYLVLAFVICISAFDPNFERSQYPSRSGDVIVLPETIQDDSFLILLDSYSVENPKQGLQIEETKIANLISSMVGGPLINSAISMQQDVAPHSHNLFNKAKANFAIFLNCIGPDVSSFPSMKILQKRSQRLDIKRVAYPQDTIASLTTFMTGHTPSVHGIVNRSWNSKKGVKMAYSVDSPSKIFNLNDHFFQTFEAQPLILSASANFQMASALGLKKGSPFGNNYGIYWNEKIADFDNLYGSSMNGLNFSAPELLKRFRSDESKAIFDLNSMEDFFFLAEIAFLQNMAQILGEKQEFLSLINDNVPDLFAFSFASLKALRGRNSVDSKKFIAAMELLDDTLMSVFEKLSNLYDGKIAFEFVFLGTSASEKLAEDQKLKGKLFSLLKSTVDKQVFDTYFPSIYLQKNTNQDSICMQVREEIENEVICTDHNSHIPTVIELVRAVGNSTSDYNENATTFQTVLWMSIIMFLFVLGAVWAIYSLDMGSDSILMRAVPKQHNQ